MIYIIRYGEIGLKGQNRPFFENKLISNIKSAIADRNAKIWRIQSRIMVETDTDVSEKLKRVFGIVTFSVAERCEPDKLYDFVLDLVKNKKFETFRITANRLEKRFKKNSIQIAMELGQLVGERLNKKVSLNDYDLNINIEIIDYAYVFFEKVECEGGIPTGVEGKVVVLVESKRGIEAAKRIMRRGCEVIPVSLKDVDISGINDYSPNKNKLIIIKNLKEVDEIAEIENARALVVEDNFSNLKDYKTKLPVLRPLCFD